VRFYECYVFLRPVDDSRFHPAVQLSCPSWKIVTRLLAINSALIETASVLLRFPSFPLSVVSLVPMTLPIALRLPAVVPENENKCGISAIRLVASVHAGGTA